MMAERILKMLRLVRKKENEDLKSNDIDTQSSQTSDDNGMTIEKFGSFSNLKCRGRDKQSLMVHLLKSKHEKLSRKKSASECCMDTEGRVQVEGVAPLCEGESNLSISSLPPAPALSASCENSRSVRELPGGGTMTMTYISKHCQHRCCYCTLLSIE